MKMNGSASPDDPTDVTIDPSLLNDDGTLNFNVACATNRLDIIKLMVKNHQLDINSKIDSFDFPGFTLLHFAVQNSKPEIIKYLILDCNADLTIQNDHGQTALHIACQMGKNNIIELILYELDRKPFDSSMNLVDNTGLSIFHISCCDHRCNLARRFIESKKIDLNARIHENSNKWPGCTALHIAVDHENNNIVKILLESGVNLEIIEKNGMTPLHFACRFNDQKIEYLHYLSEAWYASTELNILEALIDEDQENDLVDIVRYLIQYGININARDFNGKTPLLHLYDPEVEFLLHKYVADEYIIFGNKRHIIMDVLLENYADLNAVDNKGYNFFRTIAECYNKDQSLAYEKAIKVALKWKRNNLKKTSLLPLHDDESEINHDFDNEIKNDNSRIFRSYATILSENNKQNELAEFLENGLDLNFTLSNGKNLLHVLSSGRADNYFEDDFIDEGMTCLITHLIKIFLNEERRTSMIHIFNLDWNLNARDSSGSTPLHYASLRHDWRDVDLFLRLGADIDIVDNVGRTPLDCCSKETCKAQLLLLCQIKRMEKCCYNVSEQNIRIVKVSEQIPYYKENLDEMKSKEHDFQKLKDIKIIRSISLCDLLFKSTSELIPYVRNSEFLRWIGEKHLNDEFTFFVGLLRMQSIRTLEKLPFVKSAKKSLNYLAKLHLPIICSDRILDFLNRNDIEKLSEVTDLEIIRKRISERTDYHVHGFKRMKI